MYRFVERQRGRFEARKSRNIAANTSRSNIATERRRFNRINTLFRKLAELKEETGWGGFIYLSNGDEVTHRTYGGDKDLVDRFEAHVPLTVEKPNPKNCSKISMQSIYDKITKSAAIGAEPLITTPDKPTENITVTDGAIPLAAVETKVTHSRRRLSTIYAQKRKKPGKTK